jgi:2-iminobutanoate/2-iminopropanoate deaminase
MNCKIVKTDRAPAAIGPYSQGISTGPWLFVSGQLGIQPETGELVDYGFSAQARQALENLKQIILAGGSDLKNVVAVDVFLTDMGYFEEFNGIYTEFFSEHRPARAVVEVSALPRNASVEIKCIARLEG